MVPEWAAIIREDEKKKGVWSFERLFPCDHRSTVNLKLTT